MEVTILSPRTECCNPAILFRVDHHTVEKRARPSNIQNHRPTSRDGIHNAYFVTVPRATLLAFPHGKDLSLTSRAASHPIPGATGDRDQKNHQRPLKTCHLGADSPTPSPTPQPLILSMPFFTVVSPDTSGVRGWAEAR